MKQKYTATNEFHASWGVCPQTATWMFATEYTGHLITGYVASGVK